MLTIAVHIDNCRFHRLLQLTSIFIPLRLNIMRQMFSNPITGCVSILVVSLIVMGCATQNQTTSDIRTTQLPVFEGEQKENFIELSVLFLLTEDGSVEEVHLANSSGDTFWDSAAIDSMKNWNFPPPPPDAEKSWSKRTVRVEIVPAEVMNLGELIARNKDEADLLYSRLRAGASFENLIRESNTNASLAAGGRYRREIATTEYPVHVAELLHKLNVGQYTRPVEVYGEYLIIKRYGDYLPER